MTRSGATFVGIIEVVLGAAGCAGHRVEARAAAAGRLAGIETSYGELRSLRDTLDITRARGLERTPNGDALEAGDRRFEDARVRIRRMVADVDSLPLRAADRRALLTMERALDTDLAGTASEPAAPDAANDRCDAGQRTPDMAIGDTAAARTLRRHVYDCFGRAASQIVVDGDTIDRLTTLARIAGAADPAYRQRLFLALEPLWRAVNGDDGVRSPYRTLLRLTAAQGAGANPSPLERAADVGVAPATLERWLVTILDAWRAATPDSAVEPWDYYYMAAEADRRLSARIPRDSLLAVTERYYMTLGADITALGVHYDLEPRAGKDPVANTTFGSRGHAVGDRWVRAESWVFATYETGGLGNLDELVHETGHGIHLSAIHERPAYEDWPDSDPLTEAIADIPALSVYEPLWQWRFLGDSVTTAVATRAKYASIMLDIAWGLLEVRLHDHPDADPNQVWTDITSRYLHIAPHPALSWWAMRGQLIDAPGYMMNYALGAVIVTAIRERIRVVHGSFAGGDQTWYPWLSAHLLRYGLARPTRDLLREFLGGPLSADPLLRDLARMRTTARGR